MRSLLLLIPLAWLTIAGCEPTPKELPAALQAQFDVPALLSMNGSQIRETLGEPTSEFQPTTEQRELDIPATLEYTRGTTTLAIDYGNDGVVSEMFLSDKTAGRTVDQLFELGNLNQSNTDYTTKVQPWLNPSLARSNGEAEVAGIRITP